MATSSPGFTGTHSGRHLALDPSTQCRDEGFRVKGISLYDGEGYEQWGNSGIREAWKR